MVGCGAIHDSIAFFPPLVNVYFPYYIGPVIKRFSVREQFPFGKYPSVNIRLDIVTILC